MIVKNRTATGSWRVYSASLGNTSTLNLQTTGAVNTGQTTWNSATPTSTSFYLGDDSAVNSSGANHVAYLFATCPGVSKVGSYTGNGSTQAVALLVALVSS